MGDAARGAAPLDLDEIVAGAGAAAPEAPKRRAGTTPKLAVAMVITLLNETAKHAPHGSVRVQSDGEHAEQARRNWGKGALLANALPIARPSRQGKVAA